MRQKSATKKPTTSREGGANQLKTSPRSDSLGDQGGHASAKAAHWQRRRESRAKDEPSDPYGEATRQPTWAPVSNESIKVAHQYFFFDSSALVTVKPSVTGKRVYTKALYKPTRVAGR